MLMLEMINQTTVFLTMHFRHTYVGPKKKNCGLTTVAWEGITELQSRGHRKSRHTAGCTAPLTLRAGEVRGQHW